VTPVWERPFAEIYYGCHRGGPRRCNLTVCRSAESVAISTFSEQLSPAKIVAMLHSYFEQMLAAVFKNFRYLHGLVNDDLVALRDGARDHEFQDEPAGEATVEMRKALRKAENAGTSRIKTVS
jgi:hypothetical protein